MRTFKRFLKYFTLVALTLFALAGYIALGIFSLPFALKPVDYLVFALLGLTGFVFTRFIHALIHELGHLLLGIRHQFSFVGFHVGILALTRTNKHLHFQIKRPTPYAGMLLMVSKLPENINERYFGMTLGGLLGSLLTTLMFSLFLLFSPHISPYVYFLFGMGFPVSVYLFLVNAFPFYNDGALSDGAILFGIMQNDSSTIVALRLMTIQSLLFQGTCPKDIPIAYLSALPVLADNDINKIQMTVYAYTRALDSEDNVAAEEYISFLESNIDDIPELFRESVLTDIFFHTLTVRKDIEKAKALYAPIKMFVDMEPNICNLRIRMAYELYGLKQAKLSLATAKTALSLSEDYLISGIAKMETRLIELMKIEAQKQVEYETKQNEPDKLSPYTG